jgi:hypothetical protein
MQASISVSIPIETITIIMLLDTMLKLIILGTIIIHEKCIKSLLKELGSQPLFSAYSQIFNPHRLR